MSVFCTEDGVHHVVGRYVQMGKYEVLVGSDNVVNDLEVDCVLAKVGISRKSFDAYCRGQTLPSGGGVYAHDFYNFLTR